MNGLRKIESAGKVVYISIPRPDWEFRAEVAGRSISSLIELLSSTSPKTAKNILLATGERLSRRIIERRVKGKIAKPFDWAKTITEHVFNPLGIGIEFTDTSLSKIKSTQFILPTLGSQLSYTFTRGLWRNFFAEGEVLAHDNKFSFFVAKKNAKVIVERFEGKDLDKTCIKSEDRVLWESVPSLDRDFVFKVSDFALVELVNIVYENLRKKHASELVMCAAEKLGEGVFDAYVGKSIHKPFDWANLVAEHVLNPQGTGVVFSEISQHRLKTHVFKCPTSERAGTSPHIACPFSYGYTRGLWRKSFPQGEVIMGGTMGHGAPTCQFDYISQASEEHKGMRDKAKRYLSREEELRMI